MGGIKNWSRGGGGGINNVVEDTTELGGDLNVGGNSIVGGNSPINIAVPTRWYSGN